MTMTILRRSAAARAQRTKLVLAALIMAPLSVVGTISFSAIIFSGPLAPYLSQGIGMGLVGGVVLGLAGALGSTYRGSICQPQDVTAVVLSLSAASIAMRIGTADGEGLIATVLILIALSALLVGLTFLALGRLRLGSIGRFIPFPVLGGFLAATGYLIVLVGFGMAKGGRVANLWSAEAMWRWGPVLALAVLLLWAARRDKSGLGVPLILIISFGLFYAGFWLAGINLDTAGKMGLLLGPFDESAGHWRMIGPETFAKADYGAILAEVPSLLTLVGLALIGAILNASGIELASGGPVDLDRELRVLGTANLIVAGSGGLVGYHVLTDTLLARRLAGGASRWIGIAVALACGLGLIAGTDAFAVMPLGFFAAMLIYLGLDFLVEWLIVQRRRMPWPEFAVVLGIVAVAAGVGFLEAVVTGIAASSALFLVNYARLNAVRAQMTGALRLSTTERADAATERLLVLGQATLIYELQGYLFFGTAHALQDRIAADIAESSGESPCLILDFRRVQGLDISAAYNFGKLAMLCQDRGVRMILTGLDPKLSRTLATSGHLGAVAQMATLDDALTEVEDSRLRDAPQADGQGESRFTRLIDRAAAILGAAAFPSAEIAMGAVVFDQNAPSDRMILVQSGRLSARVRGPLGDEIRAARFLTGALVGEIGFLTAAPRSATIVADEPSRVRTIDRAGLDRLAVSDPALAQDILEESAVQLAKRLARTTSLLREISR